MQGDDGCDKPVPMVAFHGGCEGKENTHLFNVSMFKGGSYFMGRMVGYGIQDMFKSTVMRRTYAY
jgi:hypothetical protein